MKIFNFRFLYRVLIKSLKKVVLCLLLCAGTLSTSYGSDKKRNFDIEPSSLTYALNQLARQFNRSLLFPYEQVRAYQSSGLSGKYHFEDALNELLVDTELKAHLTDAGVMTVVIKAVSETNLEDVEPARFMKKSKNHNIKLKEKIISLNKKIVLGATLVTASTGPIQAQQDISGLTNAKRVSVLEEVIVTAQKKEQNLQDVGVSITAFTGQQLDALGWNNSLDIGAQTPGLVTTSNSGDSANIALFSVRGVSQLDFAEGQEAPIAIYQDEAYLSSPGSSGAPAFDTARIEILRGPQGTLYGRNATGGLVHFISNKPTKDFESSLDLTVADFGRVGATGVLSGPLSDAVQGRIALYHNEDDGYVKNTIGQDLRADDTTSVRGILNFEIGDNVNLELIGRYTDISSSGGVYHSRASKGLADGSVVFCQPGDTDCGTFTGDQPIGSNNFFSGGALFDVANGQIDDGIGDELEGAFDRDDAGVDREAGNITAILEAQLTNNINLTSVTDFSSSEKEYREEDDSQSRNFVTYDATADVEQFSQELRINGATENFEWIAGAYYLDISNVFTGAFAFPSDGYFPEFTGDSSTETISFFGQIDYHISDTLLLTAGIRWTQDEKDFIHQMTQCDITSPAALGFCPASLISDPVLAADPFSDNAGFAGLLVDGEQRLFTRTDTEVSGKLQLDWQVSDDHLLYAGVSRGTKGGGFNTPTDGFDLAEIEFVGFEPEILTAYEIGAKTVWADGAVRINGSAFYYDYDNFQAFFFADTTSRLINAEAEFFGAEVELTFSPGNGWDVLAGISVLDTSVNGVSPDGGTILEDEEAPLAPGFSLNGLVRKEWTLRSGGAIAGQISGNYVGEQFFNVDNQEVTQGGDYTLVDFKLSYYSPNDNWEASLFANNLFDERALTYSYDISGFGNYTIQTFGPPRWVGVNVKFNFK